MHQLYKYICIALLISVLLPVYVFSQQGKALMLNGHIPSDSNLTTFLQIIETTDQEYSIEQIHEKWDSLNQNSKPIHHRYSTLWSKFQIESGYAYPTDVIIQIGKKRSSDYAVMYVLDQNGNIIKTSRSGYFEYKKYKEVPQELGSKFILSLEPGQTYTLYFQISNISGFKPEFSVNVYSKEEFSRKISLRNLVQGMLQGALWMIFLYNLFIFFFSRDRVYFYYSLYIICIALNFVVERGIFIEYTIHWFPKLDPFVFIAATGLASVAYFQFVRYFLNTRLLMPLWDKAHLWVIRLTILVSIGLILVLLINFNIPLSINISNYINLAGIVYGFVFIFFLFKARIGLSVFFITGALALAIGTFLSLYFLITKTDLGFDAKYFMNAGMLIELLVFSLGLGARIRMIEKSERESQIELIEQLRQNDLLREKVNRELEDKVKERTSEIELQKEEILTQSESLRLANDYLIRHKAEIENKNEEIVHQKKVLERIHQNVTDSIQYASRIQSVILPSENTLAKYFTSHFIWYQPKEIVSGDFYWYRYIQKNNHRFFAIAAADATGHGVPGSLLSMLGISLLNEAMARNEIFSASQVLEILRHEIMAAFSYSDEHLLTRDGIDMAFCIIDLDNLQMQYSGANRPLLIFKGDLEKGNDPDLKPLIELKPVKNPVGMHHKQVPFENHLVQLEKGDIIYLFSDGFADQVGGPDGRKFYYKQLKELLYRLHKLPMIQQKAAIVETYNNWIGKNTQKQVFRQVDDILVLGIKI
jgi:two-component system, sensor histidine kinase LadS